MASIDQSRNGMRTQSSIADLIVKGAIALVTAAFFIGAYLQFQVTFWLAVIAALSLYISLLMLHALLRRSERADALASEVTRLEGELARAKGPDPAAYAPPARDAKARSATAPKPASPPPALGRSRLEPKAPSLPPAGPLQLPPGGASTQKPAPAPLSSTPPPAPVPRREPPTLPGWPGAAAPDSMHDYWAVRPSKSFGSEEALAQREGPTLSSPARENDDLEAVQGMIRRLASEVSLGDAPNESERRNQETAMRASVDALYTTADTMRAATTKSALGAGRRDRDASQPVPPPIAPTHARVSSVAEAVAAGRMDVELRPVVGLIDRKVHHYEVTIAPRDERGGVLPFAGSQLSRNGLVPLLDSARLRKAAQVSKSLSEEGQKPSIFTASSAESLTSDRYLDELAGAYRRREALAGELVLSFTQAHVASFGGMEWSALTDMRDLGFRFALTDVTDLDYEFTALRAAGFAFVCLGATSLLNGLSGPDGIMPAAEVCRYMGDLGLTVVVEDIEDEATRTAAVESGAPLGQGTLFGPPVVASRGEAGAGIAAA